MARRDKVELFEQIRREHEFGMGTIAGVARKLGVHRRMVREALRSAVPAEARHQQQRRLRKLEATKALIDAILLAEQWGLQGEVGSEHFARLSEGPHPEAEISSSGTRPPRRMRARTAKK
jgi:hypothetical protein